MLREAEIQMSKGLDVKKLSELISNVRNIYSDLLNTPCSVKARR